MKDIFSSIFGILGAIFILIQTVIWSLVLIFAGPEIIYWMFTGEFFHFIGNGGTTIF